MQLNKIALLVISYAIHMTVSTSDFIDLQSINNIQPSTSLKSNFSFDDDIYDSNKTSSDIDDISTFFEDELYPLPVKIILSALATSTSLITISGNLLVMCSFFLDRQIRNPTNYFILSLSVSDFLIGMFSMPLYTLYLMLDRWPFGEIICNLWLSLDYTVCLTSIYTVLFITIDRFCSVKIPAKYRKWRSPNKIILMIALTWIVPISLFFTSIFAWSYNVKFDPKNCAVAWSSNAAFSLILMFAYFWSTLTVIIILYIFIYQVAKDLEKKHLEKQTKVNALVGPKSINKFNKNALTNDYKNNNITATNLNNNNSLKIPSTIPEKNKSSSESKTKDIKISSNNKQPVKQISNNNLNSSYASTVSKEDFSSDSDHDLKNHPLHQQLQKLDNKQPEHVHNHVNHQNHQQQTNNIVNTKTQRPESLAVVATNQTDHKSSPTQQQQQQQSSTNKCASNFNQVEIVDETDQKLIEIPSTTQPQIPFIDDEFEELNYVLHRRQFGTEKLPIKEETILIKSPLKNGFFQKISLSIKSFSRRSSQKSLIDISSGNDSTEKSKLESLCLNRNDTKKSNDAKQTNGSNEEKLNLLNNNSSEKEQGKPTEPIDNSNLKDESDKQQLPKEQEPKLDKEDQKEENQKNEAKLANSESFQTHVKISDLGQKLTAVGNQLTTLVTNHQLGSNNNNNQQDQKKKQAKYENRARKALRTITFILGAFVFCFAPFHIVSAFDLFCTFCSSSKFYRHFFNTCYFLCYLNSPINPFMYALANQQFKKTFLRILKGDLRRS